jgi:hypothetical protein
LRRYIAGAITAGVELDQELLPSGVGGDFDFEISLTAGAYTRPLFSSREHFLFVALGCFAGFSDKSGSG